MLPFVCWVWKALLNDVLDKALRQQESADTCYRRKRVTARLKSVFFS
jgi:hypothetical protein